MPARDGHSATNRETTRARPPFPLIALNLIVLSLAFLPILSSHASQGTIAVVDIMLADIVKKYDDNYKAYDLLHGATTVASTVMNSTATFATSTVSSATMAVVTTAAAEPFNGVYDSSLPSTPIETLTSVCFLTGVIQLAFGICQLGAVSLILSDQLISGFSCGAAFHVIASQLPTAFGLHDVEEGSGPLSMIYVSYHTRPCCLVMSFNCVNRH